MRSRYLYLAVVAVSFWSVEVPADEPAAKSAWKYVVPRPGEPMEHPPLVPLPLAADQPEQLTQQPAPTAGSKRLFGLLRYGSPDSAQVPLVVDTADSGEYRLFVNAPRDGDVTDKQLVAADGEYRRATLSAEVTHAGRNPELIGRQVIFRRGVLGRTISMATLGYLEGQVTLAGRTVAARRVDADANGLFSDLRDRLWLDLDADGKWDAFREQFPVQPIIAHGGKRYAVRTDAAGTRLALDEITGVGTIKLELAGLAAGTTIQSIEVALMGDDGSAYAARADGAAIEVPEGGYAVRAVRMTVRPQGDTRPWNFQFTRYELPSGNQWQRIQSGQTVSVDPVGKLRLVLEGADLAKPVAAGREVTAYPRVYTADGLGITSCDFSEKQVESWGNQNYNCAQTTLCHTDGTEVSTYKSGFA